MPLLSPLVQPPLPSQIGADLRQSQALDNQGHLSRQSYYELPKKVGSNTADRNRVYDLFESYEAQRKRLNFYDVNDLVYYLFSEIMAGRWEHPGSTVLVVDEVQDFCGKNFESCTFKYQYVTVHCTLPACYQYDSLLHPCQLVCTIGAQIRLMLAICKDPNRVILCGDSAQTISRGVGFRFVDIKQMFYRRQFTEQPPHQTGVVSVVPELVHLTVNYRTTNAILAVANRLVEIMIKYFSSTIDRLPAESGFFDGPKPFLLPGVSTTLAQAHNTHSVTKSTRPAGCSPQSA